MTNQRDNVLFLLAQGTKLVKVGKGGGDRGLEADERLHDAAVYRARLDLVLAYLQVSAH